MKTHHHPGASAMLDIDYARESFETGTHRHKRMAKPPGTRKPRPRPTQRKRARRAQGTLEMAAHEHVDDIEDIVPDEMPAEYESLYELSENHPRFGHRMNAKRKRGKRSGAGTGVMGADSSDDTVEQDDYSLAVDEQNAQRLADLLLCAGADDSGNAEPHEGAEEERRFGRMALLESGTSAPCAGRDESHTAAPRHPVPASWRPTGTAKPDQRSELRSNAEPIATREWAEAALVALAHRNRPRASASVKGARPGGMAPVQPPVQADKVNVLPAAARVMQRFLMHQAVHAGSTGSTVGTSGTTGANASPRTGLPPVPFAATVEAVRQRLVDSSAAQGVKPVPRDRLGHEQEFYNLTVVLFNLTLHTPRLHLQLGAARARRRTLDRRLTGAE